MHAEAPRILVVEDDRELTGMLSGLLAGEGYVVTVAPDGHTGLHLGLTAQFDVLLVDRGLPAVEGLDLIARLRARGVNTPVLVLSARGQPAERVLGLDAGAEDYLGKPFDVDELLARLRALRRRHLPAARTLPLGGGRHLELETRTVRGEDVSAGLSERECALLALLASHPGQVFSRQQLRDRVFSDAGSDAAVDTYVHYLRRKLGRNSVSTVRGLGYRLGSW